MLYPSNEVKNQASYKYPYDETYTDISENDIFNVVKSFW